MEFNQEQQHEADGGTQVPAVREEPLGARGVLRNADRNEYTRGRPPRFEGINAQGIGRQAYAVSIYGEGQPTHASQNTGRQSHRGEGTAWQPKTPRRKGAVMGRLYIALSVLTVFSWCLLYGISGAVKRTTYQAIKRGLVAVSISVAILIGMSFFFSITGVIKHG